MKRVRLVHWNTEAGLKQAAELRRAGYRVDFSILNPALPLPLREMKRNFPDAVVIDLSHLPSVGRDLAMAFRSYKQTRTVPLVLVDGPPEKVSRIREQLPDVAYTGWRRIGTSLRHAIENPPAHPHPENSARRLRGYTLAKETGNYEGVSGFSRQSSRRLPDHSGGIA